MSHSWLSEKFLVEHPKSTFLGIFFFEFFCFNAFSFKLFIFFSTHVDAVAVCLTLFMLLNTHLSDTFVKRNPWNLLTFKSYSSFKLKKLTFVSWTDDSCCALIYFFCFRVIQENTKKNFNHTRRLLFPYRKTLKVIRMSRKWCNFCRNK